MAGNGRHGQQGIGDDPSKEGIQLVEESLGGIDIVFLDDWDHPFQIDTVRKNLFMGRSHDQGKGLGIVFDLVQCVQKGS